jgi:hypothetical protein
MPVRLRRRFKANLEIKMQCFSLRSLRLFSASSAVKIFSDAKRHSPQKFSKIFSPAAPDFSG